MYEDAGIGNPDNTLVEMVTKIGKLPLAAEPGTVWEYSRSTDVLARLVAEDYTRFMLMLINGRGLDGVHILGPKTVQYMTSDQIGASVAQTILPDPVTVLVLAPRCG
jgi:CubicO group peptidase (beta-lactamase class C family)